jgi:hypothetical protein
MALLDRSTGLVIAAGAALRSPQVRETLREGAVRGLMASMSVAEAARGAGRGAWEGARAGAAASRDPLSKANDSAS